MGTLILDNDILRKKIVAGLDEKESKRVLDTLSYVEPIYEGNTVKSGQSIISYVLEMTAILASLNCDAPTRIAGLLAEIPSIDPIATEEIEARFGHEVFVLLNSIRQLRALRERTLKSQDKQSGKNAEQQAAAQIEVLRKMLLSMASDMRVVLIRLASRVTTLRYIFANNKNDEASKNYAKETMDIYAPLANRLGVSNLKWELEDSSFRFLHPDEYKRIAELIPSTAEERVVFIEKMKARLLDVLKKVGIEAEVSGRTKHIYSIWKKLRNKSLKFSDMYDLLAFRIIVKDVKTCYEVLGLLHEMWTPLLKEYDDYISRPKPNGYQSLHTILVTDDGITIEVQIRTHEMHYLAEYGVAAHWRYKEVGSVETVESQYNKKIAWLRELLEWQTEVASAVNETQKSRDERHEQITHTHVDERIYVLTPQARVIELPKGATPIDFAYHLHSDVGHRCRGAKVDSVMVPLNTPLQSGQTVEIITAKGLNANIGPSRDWLSPGYIASSRTRSKIRAWFNAIEHQQTLEKGRTIVEKVLQREGKTSTNWETLAQKLNFAKLDDFLSEVGKGAISARNIEQVLQEEQFETAEDKEKDATLVVRKFVASNVKRDVDSGILVVGAGGLMTQLAKCCKPAPPDKITGFVTRGRGVSVHRKDCPNFLAMQKQFPERAIQTTWGESSVNALYPTDIFVLASDRQGLLRDISEIFSREKINVIGVNTQSSKGFARMFFTAEIHSGEDLNKAIGMIREIKGVQEVRRS